MDHGWKTRTLHDRYKISQSSVLGEGATAVVYKALDVEECRNVAVKLYRTDNDLQSEALEEFKKSVNVLKSLGAYAPECKSYRSTSTNSFDNQRLKEEIAGYKNSFDNNRLKEDIVTGIPESNTAVCRESTIADPILEAIDTSCCYVDLLDYSQTSSGLPGPDEEEGQLFLVLELGEESLEDRLNSYRDCGKTLSVRELQEVQWALVSIVWGLHAVGFVHMDIKPQNIMSFPFHGTSRWKLIDLDGAVVTGTEVRLEHCTYTPEYMPPELAHAWVQRQKDASAKLMMSRLMDVWSVGMCSLQAIFLQPVLRPWYEEWSSETGADDKFYHWLADYDTEPILSGDLREHVAGIDRTMCSLLECMLAKDPHKRASIAECLTHEWFEAQRKPLVKALQSGPSKLGNQSQSWSRLYSKKRTTICVAM